MKTRTRFRSLLLAACLLFTGLTLPSAAAEPVPRVGETTALSAAGWNMEDLTLEKVPASLGLSADLAGEGDAARAVDLDMVTADDVNAFTTVNEDGTRTLYSFTEPIKYRDPATGRIAFIEPAWQEAGLWRSLTAGTAFVNKAGPVQIALPHDLQAGITLTWDEAAREESAEAALSRSQTTPARTLRMTPVTEQAAPAAREQDADAVTYTDVFGEGTRLEYEVSRTGLKETLVLDQDPGTNEFAFVIQAPGMIPAEDEGRTVTFADAQTGAFAARLSEPWAIDSAETDGPHLCLDITYRLRAAGDDRYLVTMVVDPDYLTDEATVYPVRIDPTLIIGEASNSSFDYVSLFTNGTRWDNLGAIGLAQNVNALMCVKLPYLIGYKYINPLMISSAYLRMTQGLGFEYTYNVAAYEVSAISDILTVSYTTVVNNLSSSPVDSITCSDNDEYSWNVQSVVQEHLIDVLEGGTSQRFIAIKPTNSSSKRKVFYTEDDDLYLRITYLEDNSVMTGNYFIQSANGKYLTHTSSGMTEVQNFDGLPHQRWYLFRHANGMCSLLPQDDETIAMSVLNDVDINQRPIVYDDFDSSTTVKCRIVRNVDPDDHSDFSGDYRIMPAISTQRGIRVYSGTNTTSTIGGISYPKRNGIDVELYAYTGLPNQRWNFIKIDGRVSGAHMTNSNPSTGTFLGVDAIATRLSSASYSEKTTDATASEVWNLMQRSEVVIVNSTGTKTSINCGSSTTLTRTTVLGKPAGSLNHCHLVIYNHGMAGNGGPGAANLAQATLSKGARTVVAFYDTVAAAVADYWVEQFCNQLAAGCTIAEALNYSKSATSAEYTDFDTAISQIQVFGNDLWSF